MSDKVCNERKNLEPEDCVVLLIDDGSTDGSAASMSTLAERNARIKGIQFRRNSGPTAALAADFDHAEGDILISVNADGQNDLADVPAILATLLIARNSGGRLHDYSGTLKACQGKVLEPICLCGETHRFTTFYASCAGAGVAEIPVRHGLSRTYTEFLDLATVKMLGSRSPKPMYWGLGGRGRFNRLQRRTLLRTADPVREKFRRRESPDGGLSLSDGNSIPIGGPCGATRDPSLSRAPGQNSVHRPAGAWFRMKSQIEFGRRKDWRVVPVGVPALLLRRYRIG
jgi:hypothetical protein